MCVETIAFESGMPIRVCVCSIEQYPYHWHDALEMIQVLKGSIHISLGNDELLLHENDIAIVNMGELHRIKKGGEDNAILFLHIDANFYRRMFPDEDYLFLYCCSPYHEAAVPGKYERLKEYISRLVQAQNNGSGASHLEDIKRTLEAMLAYITYHFDFLRWGFGTEAFSEKHVERLKHIARHTTSDHEVALRLKDLASEENVCLQHLSNDIKNKFGLTFQELLYYGKCERAAKLLISTQARIVDIAEMCGFSDSKYLIKHFRNNFQATPSQFRKMYRAGASAMAVQLRYRKPSLSDAVKYVAAKDQNDVQGTG